MKHIGHQSFDFFEFLDFSREDNYHVSTLGYRQFFSVHEVCFLSPFVDEAYFFKVILLDQLLNSFRNVDVITAFDNSVLGQDTHISEAFPVGFIYHLLTREEAVEQDHYFHASRWYKIIDDLDSQVYLSVELPVGLVAEFFALVWFYGYGNSVSFVVYDAKDEAMTPDVFAVAKTEFLEITQLLSSLVLVCAIYDDGACWSYPS